MLPLLLRSILFLPPKQLFLRARKAPACPWQVFVASALMEWRHARQAEVARKIFEKGLEVAEFATVPEYVLAYAAFLCGELLLCYWVCSLLCCVACAVLCCLNLRRECPEGLTATPCTLSLLTRPPACLPAADPPLLLPQPQKKQTSATPPTRVCCMSVC